ncbi:Rieske 2Fe-2S domain-containing protein [Lyngbya aestuarii]|uniref:Rieske 2Fe-2S domain-containing protein n=1 Tax=Lyngbya aestuarii TaxID=118322 RepID=UPI00403E03CF
MNRREFLGWVGVGGIASFLPVALAACSPKNTNSEPSASSQSSESFQPVGKVTELDTKGQILNQQFSGGTVLVVRDPSATDKLVAVSPICTHAGCTVAWEKDQASFVCPCHGSKFASSGEVIQGPATKPLTAYKVKLEGDSILVQKS